MRTGEFMRKAFIALIEATDNPMAPIIVQRAADGIEGLGKMLANMAKPEDMRAYSELLMSAWDEEGQIDAVCGKPAFLMALAAMVKSSLEQFTIETVKARESSHDLP